MLTGSDSKTEVRREDGAVAASSRRQLSAAASPYLGGIAIVFAFVLLGTKLEAPLHREGSMLCALIVVLLIFVKLIITYQCSGLVKSMTLAGTSAALFGQFLTTTQRIDALASVPVIGRLSSWGQFLDSSTITLGIIAMFCALILAIVELGTARDALAVEGRLLLQEIDERVQAQTELAAHRDNLEVLVGQRTLELEKTQRRALANERLAMLGEIVSALGQEVRGPLGSVRTSLYTLRSKAGSDDRAPSIEAIEKAEAALIQCDRIMEDLLDLSRARDIKPQITPIDVWLSGVIEAAAIPESVQWETDLRADVAIPLDRMKMRRALMNLIKNSLQSFEENNGRERRLLVSSVREGDSCIIRLADTGSGMPETVLRELGTPLFSTRASGVGLGIPVVFETIHGHGGELTFESEMGRGTTAAIELPLRAS